MSEPFGDKLEVEEVNCFAPISKIFPHYSQQLEYQDLISLSRKYPNIIENVHVGKGDKRGCF